MLYITVLGFFQILIFIPSKVWVFLGFCFLQWHQILMINYFFVKKIKILNENIPYYITKISIQLKGIQEPNQTFHRLRLNTWITFLHLTSLSVPERKSKTKLAIITVSLLTHCCPLPYPNTVLNEYACTPNISCTIDW